jgi:class 3 adenylate cyclase
MFYHGWNGYLEYAFPSDELRSLSCDGLDRHVEETLENTSINDVLGGYSVTLVDALDTLALMGDCRGFARAVRLVENYVTFRGLNATVQVFETTIRGLGGLLSAHLYASVPRLGKCSIRGYQGSLLRLAVELGERLLPAFTAPTGLPFPRLNLLRELAGVQLTNESCASGAGSLVLEFGLLSRLTGDARFDQVARRAFTAVFDRRSKLDLVGMTLDVITGDWTPSFKYATGIGANVDSFYEYALKYAVLFDDREMLNNFTTLYRALKAHSFDGTGLFYNIDYRTGTIANNWFDSLGAFFPSVMVLSGDVADAVRTHLFYYKVWLKYGGIPERVKLVTTQTDQSRVTPMRDVRLELPWYQLRPEFVEATYYLHRATGDPFYLAVGRRVLDDLEQRYRTRCGYAGALNLATGTRADRMESFFLSETVKYLYLLFDGDNDRSGFNRQLGNFVFSTEGHPFWYDEEVLQHASLDTFEQSLLFETDYEDGDNENKKPAQSVNNYDPDALKSPETNAMLREGEGSGLYHVETQCQVAPARGIIIPPCEFYELLVRPDHQFEFDALEFFNRAKRRLPMSSNQMMMATVSDGIWSGDLDRCQCGLYDRGNDTFEVVVGRVPGLAKGHVALRDAHGDIWVDHLAGLRLKLLRVAGGAHELYRVSRIEGVEVAADAVVHVADKLAQVDFGRDGAGREMLRIAGSDVTVKGKTVENIF